MRVCVVGAGSIGGLLAVKLALSGNDVTVIARGAHLAAIESHGLKLEMDGQELVADKIRVTKDIKAAGKHDVVFLAVKAHQIEPIAQDLEELCATIDSAIVTLQNGTPWWYFQKYSGPFSGTVVRTVDPEGKLAKIIDVHRIVGCVVYPAASIKAPGIIKHHEGIRFPVGELDGSESERIKGISEMLIAAGFKSPVLPDVRSELWLKLWGSACFNPVSALTHATLGELCSYSATRQLCSDVLREIQEVGTKVGAHFRVPLERRLDGAQKVGDHKTSTLQDIENGREMELDAIIGTVVELAKLTETSVPHLETIFSLALLVNEQIRKGNRIRAERL